MERDESTLICVNAYYVSIRLISLRCTLLWKALWIIVRVIKPRC